MPKGGYGQFCWRKVKKIGNEVFIDWAIGIRKVVRLNEHFQRSGLETRLECIKS